MNENDRLTALIQVGMAALGALARMLNKWEANTPISHAVWHSLRQVFIAGFTGAMLFWLTRDMDLKSGWVYALSGMAGWIGPSAMDAVVKAIQKKTGFVLEDKPGEAGE